MHPVFRAEDVTATKVKTPKWKTFFKTKVVGGFKGAVRLLVTSPVKLGRRAEVENRPRWRRGSSRARPTAPCSCRSWSR